MLILAIIGVERLNIGFFPMLVHFHQLIAQWWTPSVPSLLPDSAALGLSYGFKGFLKKIIDVTELTNLSALHRVRMGIAKRFIVDQTHSVLASGKEVLQKTSSTCSASQCSELKTMVLQALYRSFLKREEQGPKEPNAVLALKNYNSFLLALLLNRAFELVR